MRSQNIIRQSQLLLKNSVVSPSAQSQLQRSCLQRGRNLPLRHGHYVRHLSSTVDPPQAPVNSDAAATSKTPEPSEMPPPQETEDIQTEELTKVKIRRTRPTTASKEAETIELPEGINVFWVPEEQSAPAPSPTIESEGPPESPSDLPPPEIIDEALNNLLITLHPQIQHRATYSPTGDVPVEPTLGLYCPIEGGDYIIDATVRELARKTGAEVLVLDSVQLAAGEWGQFGKAANSLHLPVHPLKFPSTQHPPQYDASETEDSSQTEQDGDLGFTAPQSMTLTLLAPPQLLSQGRTSLVSGNSRRPPTRSKIKVFFDALVNSSPPSSDVSTRKTTETRPRIVYVRDFTTLAATSSVWYAPLLAAVRERRRGPMSRPTSPVCQPITIVFGMTPSMVSHQPNGPPGGLISFLMNQNSHHGFAPPDAKQEKIEWTESEAAERARERRLQDRLKKWERHENLLYQELPKLATSFEEETPSKPEVVVIGPSGRTMPSMFGPSSLRPGANSDTGKKTSFFRTSVIVPANRSQSRERSARIARRREINELTMRMGVGAIGGTVETTSASEHFAQPVAEPASAEAPANQEQEPAPQENVEPNLWDTWGDRIETWRNVKRVADNAVGYVLSSASGSASHLEATVVPWSAVQAAWKTHKVSKSYRKTWLKDFGLNTVAEGEETALPGASTQVDEVVERVKNEADLDQYEQRLIGCIVDSASMPTSFSQVHLPPHVIDSVRTIVSLPLLHPLAFKQGILKQHGMSGCLLFGPPGTGKTLVVRALAKEAGCRMLVVTPSDIMDMYVGEAEKLVRATFSLARRLAPCVVFLDEIDALFGARMAARESGGAAAAHRGVITEFMQEMDGLKTSREDGIIVIGATNRPFDLDDAVLRRLPRRLLVDLPGVKEREEILKILLRDETIDSDVTLQFLAQKTESFSGSDLKHLCVSAALDAVKERVHVPWLSNANVQAVTTESTHDSLGVTPDKAGHSEVQSVDVGIAEHIPPVNSESETPQSPSKDAAEVPPPATHSRTLHRRNFLKALKEITPSSSESSGSLSDLRKWNEEFGEGRNDKRNKQVWGKGRFGFVDERKPDSNSAPPSSHGS
ncbi:AAA-domain-containing protein [Coprinopsis marcescibilis]|uniref:AAA-domain-containing protein n=1 Tax=Coprinopsis marcescibilis TaxID=230819 RepID=A0A5C3LB67_COPMA|nr:AAA-domain-containing protein [Coprinopsis marcescibilis]